MIRINLLASERRAAKVRRADPLPDIATNIRRVYGFGINPADGVLYAATDQGLYQIESAGEERPERELSGPRQAGSCADGGAHDRSQQHRAAMRAGLQRGPSRSPPCRRRRAP